MQRIPLASRPDWQATAERLGFTWHHDSGAAYWDEQKARQARQASRSGADNGES